MGFCKDECLSTARTASSYIQVMVNKYTVCIFNSKMLSSLVSANNMQWADASHLLMFFTRLSCCFTALKSL